MGISEPGVRKVRIAKRASHKARQNRGKGALSTATSRPLRINRLDLPARHLVHHRYTASPGLSCITSSPFHRSSNQHTAADAPMGTRPIAPPLSLTLTTSHSVPCRPTEHWAAKALVGFDRSSSAIDQPGLLSISCWLHRSDTHDCRPQQRWHDPLIRASTEDSTPWPCPAVIKHSGRCAVIPRSRPLPSGDAAVLF